MYTRPEKMKALMERLLPWQLQYGIDGAKALGHPIVTVYLYKGADGLMSDEQYEEFYWPTLKRLLLGLVEEGLLVWVFTQGKYDSRLHHFKEIPAGTCLIHLESGTDAFLAKEVLAGLAVHRGQRVQRAAGHGVRRRGRGLLREARRGLRQGRRLHDGLLGLPRRGQAGERQEDDRGREAHGDRRRDQGRPLRQGRDSARVPLDAALHLRRSSCLPEGRLPGP